MSKRSRRDRRDVGDETRGRIDELAGGWKVPAEAVTGDEGDDRPARAAAGTPVNTQKAPPGPPPGAKEKKASAAAKTARSKARSSARAEEAKPAPAGRPRADSDAPTEAPPDPPAARRPHADSDAPTEAPPDRPLPGRSDSSAADLDPADEAPTIQLERSEVSGPARPAPLPPRAAETGRQPPRNPLPPPTRAPRPAGDDASGPSAARPVRRSAPPPPPAASGADPAAPRPARRSAPPPPPPPSESGPVAARSARRSAPPPPPPSDSAARASSPAAEAPKSDRVRAIPAAAEAPKSDRLRALDAPQSDRVRAIAPGSDRVQAIAPTKPRRDEETAIDPAATERAAASVGKPSSLPPPAVVAPDVDDDAETVLVPPDAPIPERPPTAALTGSVRLPESVPRESGVLGDVVYVWRVLRKVPAARRELSNLDDKIVTEREGRAQRLLEVARNALADADLDTTLVGRAREHLVTLEEMRSQHAGAVAAADEEVAAIEREREEGKDERAERRDELRRERESIEESLEPLRKRQTQARKRFAAVKKTLDKLAAQLTAAEAKLLEAESGADARACEAQIAGLSAERESVASEEPEIAAELDELEPKIASLESALADNEATLARLAKEDEKAERRAADKIAAVRARQTVDEGVATDLASERQEALLALGEGLSDSRPDQFAWRLRAIEEHDLAIATLQRRAVELRELLANIEIWPLVRGGLWLLLVAGAIAAILLFAASR